MSSTRPARPVGRSRGVPRGLTAEPEVVSRTRRPRTRRGGTTPSAVSTRRRPRSAKGVFGHVAENAVPRSIFFLRYCGGDFAQNFRDARSGRDLATINHRAPRRPQRRRRKSLRSGIVPRQGRVLGIPRVVLHAPAAPRPAQGWRRTDRSPQTSVAPYVWRTPPFLATGRNAVKPGFLALIRTALTSALTTEIKCSLQRAYPQLRAEKSAAEKQRAAAEFSLEEPVQVLPGVDQRARQTRIETRSRGPQ